MSHTAQQSVLVYVITPYIPSKTHKDGRITSGVMHLCGICPEVVKSPWSPLSPVAYAVSNIRKSGFRYEWARHGGSLTGAVVVPVAIAARVVSRGLDARLQQHHEVENEMSSVWLTQVEGGWRREACRSVRHVLQTTGRQ